MKVDHEIMTTTTKVAVNRKESVGVVVFAAFEETDASFLSEILLGLEEEGLPYAVSRIATETRDIRVLAHQAAGTSVFEIGLCCSDRGVVLHHAKLLPEKPIFHVPKASLNAKVARNLGMNAARLVKKQPLVKIG